jgi:hypothetical protein
MLFKALISIQYISPCQKDLKGAHPHGLLSVWVISKTGVPPIIERR